VAKIKVEEAEVLLKQQQLSIFKPPPTTTTMVEIQPASFPNWICWFAGLVILVAAVIIYLWDLQCKNQITLVTDLQQGVMETHNSN
jgi:hypothetical protein